MSTKTYLATADFVINIIVKAILYLQASISLYLNLPHFVCLYYYALQPLRLIVRSGLDVPTFATRRLHACHNARAPSGGRWNCGREMSEDFA